MKIEDFENHELAMIYQSELKIEFIEEDFINILGNFVYKSIKHASYKQQEDKLNLIIKILNSDFDIHQIYTEEQKRNNFIHYAAKGLDPEIIFLLINKKCDLNSFNNSFRTPLMLALEVINPTDKTHIKAFKMLLDAQTDIDMCDHQNKTAFQFILDKTIRIIKKSTENEPTNNVLSITNNYLKLCKLMISHGSDIKKYKYSSNILTDKNLFNVAIDLNNELLFDFIIESGLDINHKSLPIDVLPIIYASQKTYGLPYIKKVLNIPESFKNIKEDNNPVIKAIMLNYVDIAKELVEYSVPYDLKMALNQSCTHKDNSISFYLIDKNMENLDEVETILNTFSSFKGQSVMDMVKKIKFSQKMENALTETNVNKKLKL